MRAATEAGAPRAVHGRWARLRLAPDGQPRPDAPFARGPLAARVLAVVIVAAAAVGSRLPVRLAHTLAVAGGHVEWAVRPAKRRRLARNLSHAIGAPATSTEVRRTVRREIVNEARRSADLLWAIGRPGEFLRTVRVEGLDEVRARLTAGQGVVLAGVHLGGWEVASMLPRGLLPVPTTAVVADNWLAWGMQHVRSRGGLRLAYRSAPATGLVRRLRQGEALLVLGDDASGPPPRRLAVRFCRSVAALPAGPVVLARLGRAVLVPFAVLPIGPRRWRVVLGKPVDPPLRRDDDASVAQQLADRWTEAIVERPDLWAASFPIQWLDGGSLA